MKNKYKILLAAILLLASVLRLWRLTEIPISLFADELDVGYHAYSILETGKDYSGNSWPLHFQSLAESRAPLYLYMTIPTVAIYGISPLGVRLPAAFFGILGILGLYLLVKQISKNEKLALASAVFLAISPWHIQYSRAAFEVTMLLAFLLFGLYFFFRSFKEGKWLWVASILLVTTPLIYSTAKLFTPGLLLVLFLLWKKEISKLSKNHLIKAVVALIIFGGITSYATLFSGGEQRFEYISVFSDPTIEPEVGTARLRDARMRNEKGYGLTPSFSDRFFHNKVIFWTENITKNILESFSADFLFINGDLNLRHSIKNVGQFYKVEFIAMVLGLILFFTKYKNKQLKIFLAFWLIFGAIPAVITRDGGRHATRLILMLPPLIFLVAYGFVKTASLLKGNSRKIFLLGYIGLLIFSFASYQHEFWGHNPWDSERWWHSGYEESVKTIKEIDKDYDKVILSMINEPAWIFFAGWYEYPPDQWQAEFPIHNEVNIAGFGRVSHIDKFYFGSIPESVGINGLGKVIDTKTLYLAVASEVEANLIMEPKKVPFGLQLIKAIPYPSGEPAFYLFTKDSK